MTTNLKLPNNYVELSQEEMMYLDGGYWINLSRRFVTNAINFALAIAGCWGSICNIVKLIGKRKLQMIVVKTVTAWGVAWTTAKNILSVVNFFASVSVGSIAAYALDRFDRSGLNGHIQF